VRSNLDYSIGAYGRASQRFAFFRRGLRRGLHHQPHARRDGAVRHAGHLHRLGDETGPSAADWVAGFADPRLELLISEALEGNPTILAARASLDAAEASARASNAGRLPTLDAGLTASESDGPAGSATSFGLGLDASWQADIWGRLTDNARAGVLSAEAARADWYGARLSIAAATARAWYALNEAALQTELSRQDVETRTRQLEIVVRRFNRGVSRSSDVRTARSALASSEAALASREQARSGRRPHA
jgi:multidrug efflux system outer membrane protein